VKPYRCSSKILTSSKFESVIHELSDELEKISAVEVAELFLSPNISTEVFIEATFEPGPSLWLVNRSDISTAVLEKLLKHPVTNISDRAAEKLKMRKATITHLTPPEIEEDLSKVEDYSIEDILGHPLCPWEAMLFFAIHPNEDVRSSACLSLTRRLWEHPSQSQDFPQIESQFKDVFSVLAGEDLSPMVRAYAARIPIWTAGEVGDFLIAETHPHVQAKWLQHDLCPESVLTTLPNEFTNDPSMMFLRRVFALDRRVPTSVRQSLCTSSIDTIEKLSHGAYLA
jgi:hypothetical protein